MKLLLLLVLLTACGSQHTVEYKQPQNCKTEFDDFIQKNVIKCPDGSKVVISDGVDGTNGTDANELVFHSTPATKAQCSNDGTVLYLGLDLNKNSTLDTDEINQTIVLCNGKKK